MNMRARCTAILQHSSSAIPNCVSATHRNRCVCRQNCLKFSTRNLTNTFSTSANTPTSTVRIRAHAYCFPNCWHATPFPTCYARAAHHLSAIAKADGDEASCVYYLVQSTISDLRSATREMASLQELGALLYTRGDIDRAYAYLSTALANAVECGAEVRMLESARSLPYIEQAYARKAAEAHRRDMWIMAGMAVLVIVLIGSLVALRVEMKRMSRLQERLRSANKAKEVYISQFLTLCSVYMDKLKQFSKLVTRKIGAGQVDDLYRMAKNGKFVEEESREFYEVFDNAFLHIYPTFIDEVNALLRPDEQIIPKEGERLNTDLRILAFMRLGIEDSSSIAQVLNYSLNTIYAYRNRLKARAIDRENFERNIMGIGS